MIGISELKNPGRLVHRAPQWRARYLPCRAVSLTQINASFPRSYDVSKTAKPTPNFSRRLVVAGQNDAGTAPRHSAVAMGAVSTCGRRLMNRNDCRQNPF